MFPLNRTAKVFGVAFVIALGVIVYGASGTPSTLRVMTDANHALIIAGGAQVNPVTTSTFNNTRFATDATGKLLVVGAGGGITGGSCPNGFVVAINTSGVPTCSTSADEIRNVGALNIGNGPGFALQVVASNLPEFEANTGVKAIAWNLRDVSLGAGWGSGATISARSVQSQGQVTLGTSPSATTLVLSTDSSFANPQCVVQNTSVPSLLKYSYDSGTGDFTITGTGFTVGNVIEWVCTDRRAS